MARIRQNVQFSPGPSGKKISYPTECMQRNGSTMRPSFAALWIRTLKKPELHLLIDDVKRGDKEAASRAVAFVVAESFGIWHNRARAKLCRYFKNHPPSDDQCRSMVDAIENRLIDGRFYEQFKDQLSMAIRFAFERIAEPAAVASSSEKDYIRRYGAWIRHALDSSTTTPSRG